MTTARCAACGRTDVVVDEYECTWPDGHVTIERHCPYCIRTWHRQLRVLGARLRPVSGDPPPDLGPLLKPDPP